MNTHSPTTTGGTAVALPPSVESLLQKICTERNQTPPDPQVRRQVADVGEQASLRILNFISEAKTLRTLSGYIIFLINKDYGSNKSPRAQSTEESFAPARSPLSRGSLSSISSPIPPPSANGNNFQSPIAKRSLFSSPLSSKRPSSSTPRCSPHLLALSGLEFRKAFLILSYIGRAKLEEVVSEDKILLWKDLPMWHFESQVWESLGRHCLLKKDKSPDETERRQYSDWDSGRTHIYHCHVLQDGRYIFKGPFLGSTRTHLQRVLGDENVLLVKFAEDSAHSTIKMSHPSNYDAAFNTIADEGIFVGLRRYRFFVFKDGGKEEKKKSPTSSSVKCHFVRMESLAPCDEGENYPLTNKTVGESRCLFMHTHMVSTLEKYMARFSLTLSNTIKLPVDFTSINVNIADDIPCLNEYGSPVKNEDQEPLIHTDGTGFISEDLALKVPKDFSRAKYSSGENFEQFLGYATDENFLNSRESNPQMKEPPLLMQVRLFYNGSAVKGTLLVNKQLPERTIVIRHSMIKVTMDPRLSNAPTFNSLEIVGVSNKPGKTYLSKNLIALLNYGGVPKEYFLDIMGNALEEARSVCYNKSTALRVALNRGGMDDFVAARMILCGIPLNEPCLHYRLSIFGNEERKGLRGGRLPISESFYLMGTADPTGKLENNEVCVILDNGQISGDVLVYRNPGLHFGDIHKLRATYVKAMEDFVGNAKYAIFFSTKGRRSVGSELANRDFDGDMYWVSRNPQLLSSFKVSEPWSRIHSTPSKTSRNPSELSADKLEIELFRLFLRTRFQKSNCMGVAADSWHAFMDRLLILGDSCADEKQQMKEKMHKLVDLYYDALDAPKSGKQVKIPEELTIRKFPHYLEKDNKYQSSSVLGLLYDMASSNQSNDATDVGVRKLPCLDVEVPKLYMELWGRRYTEYKTEMHEALSSTTEKESKEIAANVLIQKYKQLLYDAPEFEDSPRNPDVIFNESLAIYHACYDEADNKGEVKKCCFAWRVAGPALCKFYAANNSEKSRKLLIVSPSVLGDLLN